MVVFPVPGAVTVVQLVFAVATVGVLHATGVAKVAEAPWSEAEWGVAPRFDHPRATVPVLLLG